MPVQCERWLFGQQWPWTGFSHGLLGGELVNEFLNVAGKPQAQATNFYGHWVQPGLHTGVPFAPGDGKVLQHRPESHERFVYG